MSDLPLAALRAFASVYEQGGVRAAARVLRVTHSSVSRYVRDLEAWLGAPLISRAGRGRLQLTPQGEALGRAASNGLRDLVHAVESVREARRGNSLVIATTASIAARWLLPRLSRLREQHPSLEVSVLTEDSVEDVTEQRADLAIRMGAGPWPGEQASVLMDDTLFPVASASYWSMLPRASPQAALAQATLLHDRDPIATWARWFQAHPSSQADPRRGPRFTSSDLVLRAAAEGLGVALARGRLVADDLARGGLIRPFGDLAVVVPQAYWLIRRPDDGRAAEALVVEWLRSEARAQELDLPSPNGREAEA